VHVWFDFGTAIGNWLDMAGSSSPIVVTCVIMFAIYLNTAKKLFLIYGFIFSRTSCACFAAAIFYILIYGTSHGWLCLAYQFDSVGNLEWFNQPWKNIKEVFDFHLAMLENQTVHCTQHDPSFLEEWVCAWKFANPCLVGRKQLDCSL
jgi:hypothetical protein